MHDTRHNEVNDEILVPNPFANALLVFKGGANGQEAPIRIIQGAKTLLDGPDSCGGQRRRRASSTRLPVGLAAMASTSRQNTRLLQGGARGATTL